MASYSCDQCAQKFERIDNLQRHVASVHEKRRFRCTSCDKVFSRQTNANRHAKQHKDGADVVRLKERSNAQKEDVREDLKAKTRQLEATVNVKRKVISNLKYEKEEQQLKIEHLQRRKESNAKHIQSLEASNERLREQYQEIATENKQLNRELKKVKEKLKIAELLVQAAPVVPAVCTVLSTRPADAKKTAKDEETQTDPDQWEPYAEGSEAQWQNDFELIVEAL